ncbi:uncharacterized protein A4U43_C07F28040 [Asparagus officinalis]|uniref:Uncharacterized protein n=1 Tax=Asparagus officinalis TaxID=4686 RepID=A0A5P1EJ46_ASPOF|nr:uncharacterized protein A4U43_C07F28040 [Asparagus officinalis]
MKHFALVAAASAAVTASSSVALSAAADCSVSNKTNTHKGSISSGSIRGVQKKGIIFPRLDGLRFIETLVTAHR